MIDPATGRSMLDILDLIDEARPQAADVFILKGVVIRLIRELSNVEEDQEPDRCQNRETGRETMKRQCRLDPGHDGKCRFGRRI